MISCLFSLHTIALQLAQRGTPQAIRPSPSPAGSPASANLSGGMPAPPQDAGGWLGDYFGNFFVYAIWGLFLVSLFSLVRYLRRLPAQEHALALVRRNYEEVVKTAETDPVALRAELLRDVDADSVVAQRVEELSRIGAHSGDFDQAALAEVVAAREAARTGFARYAASVLVLLGLCGAIWGLSNLVFAMGDQLREVQQHMARADAGAAGVAGEKTATVTDSLDQLIDTMSDSLKHTRGAFYASLTGVLLSVVLLFMNWWVGRRQVAFLAELEAITATKLIPVFKPPRQAQELAEVANSFREGSDYLVRLSDGLDDKVMQIGGNLENLFAIVRKFGEGADALRLNQERVHDAQSHMLGVVEQFTALTGRIEGHQAGARENINQVVDAVRENSKSFGRAIEEWQRKHETLMQLTQNASRQAHHEAAQTRELVEQALRETNSLLRDAVSQQLNDLRAQALEMLERQQAMNRTQLAEVVADNGRFVAGLQEAFASGNGHSHLVEVARNLAGERGDIAAQLEGALRRMQSSLADGLGRLAEQNGELAGAIRETRVAVPRADERRPFQASAPPSDFGALASKQQTLINRVGDLGRHVGQLSALLSAVVVICSASALSLGTFATLSFFGLWPGGGWPRVAVFVSAILLPVAAGAGLSAWLLGRHARGGRSAAPSSGYLRPDGEYPAAGRAAGGYTVGRSDGDREGRTYDLPAGVATATGGGRDVGESLATAAVPPRGEVTQAERGAGDATQES